MALGLNPIDFTEPIEATTYEGEQLFQKAIKAWEEKYLDDPLVEDANSPDMIWLYSYHGILSRGIACLQRRRRLIEGQPASLTNKVDEEEEEEKKKKKKKKEQEEEEEKEKEKNRWWPFLWFQSLYSQGEEQSAEQDSMAERPPDSPPGYLEACESSFSSQVEEEIHEMTQGYWESVCEMQESERRQPSMAPMLERLDILRYNFDRHGHSYYWVCSSEFCADRGGCCGRPCGCCEKPLLTYKKRLRYDEQRIEVLVYGHCSRECPCCIRVRRRYNPHPDLPKPQF